MSASAQASNDVPLDRERDRPHPLQIELYRRATPTQKLAIVARMNAMALAMKDSSLRTRFPTLTEAERRTRVRHWWLTSRD
jgi:hypothetical protein